jgi:hypothetical protein
LTDKKVDDDELYASIVDKIQPAMALAQERCDQAPWIFVEGALTVSCIGMFRLSLSFRLYQPKTWYVSFRTIYVLQK